MSFCLAIWSNASRDKDYQVTLSLIHYLESKNLSYVVDKELAFYFQSLGKKVESDFRKATVLMVLGGDGTILTAVHHLPHWDLPIVGVNMGSVGFMNEIPLHQLFASVDKLYRGDYQISKRMLLQVDCYDQEGRKKLSDFALNDAVFQRNSLSHIAHYHVQIDGFTTELIRSDGLVVASPTGSTGYALAAGGPIVAPCQQLLLVVPICPHSFNNRPYICDPNTKITIRLANDQAQIGLNVDGRIHQTLSYGDRTVITNHEKQLNFVEFNPDSFYQTLQEKLKLRSSGTSIG